MGKTGITTVVRLITAATIDERLSTLRRQRLAPSAAAAAGRTRPCNHSSAGSTSAAPVDAAEAATPPLALLRHAVFAELQGRGAAGGAAVPPHARRASEPGCRQPPGALDGPLSSFAGSF